MRRRANGFGLMDAMILLFVVIGIGAFVSCLISENSPRRSGRNQMPNSSKVRGIHQSMVIFAQNNNTYLPGLNNIGIPLSSTDAAYNALSAKASGGASFSGRFYILLNGSFVDGDVLINPQDVKNKWTSSLLMPTTDQFSYSLLRIGDSAKATDWGSQFGRVVEWRDNANSQAILISDRNTGVAATSDRVRSVWATTPGTSAYWRGTVLWGDNHAEFLNADNARLGMLSLNTRYGTTINSDDFLFGSADGPGKVGSASAMFGYVSEDF